MTAAHHGNVTDVTKMYTKKLVKMANLSHIFYHSFFKKRKRPHDQGSRRLH